MMKTFKSILFASLLIILIGCGNNTKKGKQNDSPKDWKTLDRSDFSIQYPDSLALNKSGKMGTNFILFLDQKPQKDSFRENINLTTEDLTGKNVDLDKYVKISKNQVNNIITDGELIKSDRLKQNKREFHKIIYTGRQGKFNLKWKQLYCVKDEKAYVLTLTCEESQYKKYGDVTNKIMSTFRIK